MTFFIAKYYCFRSLLKKSLNNTRNKKKHKGVTAYIDTFLITR